MQISTNSDFSTYSQNIQQTSTKPNQKNIYLNETPSDPIKVAFEKASDLVSSFVSNDMKHKLQVENISTDDAIKRAEVLKSSSLNSSAEEAIKTQNLMLASRNLPPMKPSEEKAFIDLMRSSAKERNLFLDSFINILNNRSIKLSA